MKGIDLLDPKAGLSWIFVSHASADLHAVRRVRNYLESKGACPLLFHLLAMKREDEFWPVIEQEIAERDFFLLCESQAAANSVWVQRERDAVHRADRHQRKRIGSIRVDGGSLDFDVLDRFLGTMRVFPSYSRTDRIIVDPILRILETRGFEVFDFARDLRPGDGFEFQVDFALSGAATYGFVIIFLSNHSIKSESILRELEQAQRLKARLIPVVIDQNLNHASLPGSLRLVQFFDATSQEATAPERLADFLHSRAL